MGWLCSDTEPGFSDVRVPVANLVGPENSGFLQIMQQFQVERAFLAVRCHATAQRCLDLTPELGEAARNLRPAAVHQTGVVRHKIVDGPRPWTWPVPVPVPPWTASRVTQTCGWSRWAKNQAVETGTIATRAS